MSRWPPRPSLSPLFYKAHGLGNDYLVFEEGEGWEATEANVRRVCHRFRGVGSDGIVVLLRSVADGGGVEGSRSSMEVSLRMFNPDGGEFERSGNGLRVLGSFLARRHPDLERLGATVGGERVEMRFHGSDGPVHDISVAMGRARIGPEVVDLDPGALTPAGDLPGPDGELLTVVPVSVGNPHLVVLSPTGDPPPTEARLAEVGPFLATHPALRHGANVQLVTLVGPGRCRALIWERGVGRTEASGTSSCAVAVALVSAGRVEAGSLTVEMPGGTLTVDVSPELDVVLRGPVEEVFEGRLSPALLATFGRGS